jgi:magnesium transporter
LEQHLGVERIADAVAELDPSEAARLLVRVSRAEAADILEEMEPDDATDVVEELGEEAERILAEMEVTEASEIRDLLTYPSATAGGRMTPRFVSIRPDLTVGAAMRLLRAQAPDAETIYYIYVTDHEDHLVGVVSLRQLVVADPQQRIEALLRPDVIRVPAEIDQEDVARLLMDHDLLALPVVDEEERLLGVITADDVADVLQEEATEDIERLGGSQPLGEPYLQASPFLLFRKRIVWLLFLFLGALQTSTILQAFSDELSSFVALSFFIPLLVSTGGNAGSQVVTTVIRAMAVGEVRFRDVWVVLRRELLVGLLVGGVMGLATLLRAQTMHVDAHVAITAGLAATAIVVWATAVAALLPIGLRRLRLDPAVMSAPLIATLVDGTGLLIYLLIAKNVLGL